MRLLVPLILLLVQGCDSERGRGDSPSAPGPAGIPSDLLDPVPVQIDLVALRSRAERALRASSSLEAVGDMRAIRAGTEKSICGEVSDQGPGEAGKFRPFIVLPNDAVLVSASPRIALDDLADAFVDSWIRYCSTKEDLSRLGEAPTGGTSDQNAIPPDIPPPPRAPPPLPEPPSDFEIPADPIPPPTPSLPEATIDSFANAVAKD